MPLLARILAFCALALVTMTLPAGPAAAGGSDPEVVLDEVFGHVDAMCGGDGQGAPYDLSAIAETYFTAELAKTLETALASDLGFDILIDAQDCRTTDLSLEVVEADAGSAVGRATFKNMGEDRIIDLVMAKAGETWKVADVVYRHRPFSLKAAQ